MDVLARLEQAAEPYRQAGYILTTQAATSITLRQTRGSFSALLYVLLRLIFWPIALLYLGSSVNRRERAVCLRLTSQGMIEEDGYTLEHARRERQRMAIFIAIGLLLVLTVVAVILIVSLPSSKPPDVALHPSVIEQRNMSTWPGTREYVPIPPPPAIKPVHQPAGLPAPSMPLDSVQGKAILAVMREHIEDEAEQKVSFQNVSIRVQGEWALFKAEMRGEKGGKVSTYLPEDGSPAHPTSRVVALLRVTQLGWSVQTIDSSATNNSVAWLRREMPNAPPGLFATSEEQGKNEGQK
jgi:hypothetical protein